MRRHSIVLLTALLVLAMVVGALPQGAMASSKGSTLPILVRALDPSGTPVAGAVVSLVDHSRTPSEVIANVETDSNGYAQFDYPEFKAQGNEFAQHLSVTVMADGYKPGIKDWSVTRKELKQVGGKSSIVDVDAAPSVVEVGLVASDMVSTAPALGDVQINTMIGEKRQRLLPNAVNIYVPWLGLSASLSTSQTTAATTYWGYSNSSSTYYYLTGADTNGRIYVKLR